MTVFSLWYDGPTCMPLPVVGNLLQRLNLSVVLSLSTTHMRRTSFLKKPRVRTFRLHTFHSFLSYPSNFRITVNNRFFILNSSHSSPAMDNETDHGIPEDVDKIHPQNSKIQRQKPKANKFQWHQQN